MVRDSNPRHLRCKRSALTTELTTRRARAALARRAPPCKSGQRGNGAGDERFELRHLRCERSALSTELITPPGAASLAILAGWSARGLSSAAPLPGRGRAKLDGQDVWTIRIGLAVLDHELAHAVCSHQLVVAVQGLAQLLEHQIEHDLGIGAFHRRAFADRLEQIGALEARVGPGRVQGPCRPPRVCGVSGCGVSGSMATARRWLRACAACSAGMWRRCRGSLARLLLRVGLVTPLRPAGVDFPGRLPRCSCCSICHSCHFALFLVAAFRFGRARGSTSVVRHLYTRPPRAGQPPHAHGGQRLARTQGAAVPARPADQFGERGRNS